MCTQLNRGQSVQELEARADADAYGDALPSSPQYAQPVGGRQEDSASSDAADAFAQQQQDACTSIAAVVEAVKRAVADSRALAAAAGEWRKPASRTLMVTDCGHVFHSACLLAYESFHCHSRLSRPVCPVCRAVYRKQMVAPKAPAAEESMDATDDACAQSPEKAAPAPAMHSAQPVLV